MIGLGTLKLTITNTQRLLPGNAVNKTFDTKGGTIGSDPSSYWYIKDQHGQIQGTHCHISIVDNHYCITDTSNNTFVNHASFPIGWNKRAKLNENDTINIGPFEIRVSMVDEAKEAMSGIENVFIEDDEFDFDDKALSFSAKAEDADIDDPISALNAIREEQPTLSGTNTSPDQMANSDQCLVDNYQNHTLQSTMRRTNTIEADTQFNSSSAMTMSPISRQAQSSQSYATQASTDRSTGNSMDNTLDLLEQEMKSHYSETAEKPGVSNNSHMVTGPLLRGLGADTANSADMNEMHCLSEEMGASLKSAIKGLLNLHQHGSMSRYGVMNKSLQPIEDNPLRLGMNYEETVKMLFDAEPSPVHLSAPEAIEESLQQVVQHDEAVQSAISTALAQILDAFSPETLMRRFNRYRRSGNAGNESPEAWAWNMYQNYYQELTSNRQNGFEKLFWEIFEQAYDTDLRQKQES